MIKIVQGTYGHKVGLKIVPKTSKDDPFELTPEQEERLVKKGVAVYIKAAPIKAPEVTNLNPGNDELPLYNLDMTREKLNKIALLYGVKEPEKLVNKKELITLLDQSKGTTAESNKDTKDDAEETDPEADEEEDELPPSFDPADAVE